MFLKLFLFDHQDNWRI